MIHWQPGTTLDEVEKQVILIAYEHYGKNKTKTAQSLGIAIRTLDNKLERYNGIRTEAGVHVEPSKELSKEQSMPVRQWQKI